MTDLLGPIFLKHQVGYLGIFLPRTRDEDKQNLGDDGLVTAAKDT